MFLKLLDGCWPLGSLLGELRGHWEPTWSGPKASWSLVVVILTNLVISRAILEAAFGSLRPSWSH
eukprot:3049697-Pyramimonas_sp.AAC.1